MLDKRFPSPESIRALHERLRNGVTVEEKESIDELLHSARKRVMAVLPPDITQILARLATVPAPALEAYALLQQPVKAKIVKQKAVNE